jgi:hypothetical protein
LNVASNGLGPAGVALLAKNIACLHSLDISCNRIVRGGRTHESSWTHHPYRDDAFDIDLVGVTALTAAFDASDGVCSLRELNLSQNGLPMELQAQLKTSCDSKGIALECDGKSIIVEKYPTAEEYEHANTHQ